MMRKKILLLFTLLCSNTIAFSQSVDSVIIDSTSIMNDTSISLIDSYLNNEELVFQDSISLLNEQNDKFSSSRKKYNSGLEFFNDRSIDSAIVSFTKAVVIDSTFSQAYFYRAKCYDNSDIDLAILDYNMAFKFDSTNLLPLYCIAKLQSAYLVKEAFNTYYLINSYDNKQSKAHYEIGVLFYLQEDFEEAIVSFTNSIAIMKDARTFNDRASCYRILDSNESAINDYISAISLDSDLAFIYNNLASTYRKQGDSKNALSYYSLSISKDSNYVLAYNNRGSLYLDLNDVKNALIDIDKAISIDNNYAPAHNNKGVMYHQQKNYTEALVCFDKAILLNNNYAKALLNRGITRQMIRDEDGACNDWIRANELGINIANKYSRNDCN